MRKLFIVAGLALSVLPAAAQQTRIAVTVFNEKTGNAATNLQASAFAVSDGGTALRVDEARYVEGILDVMLIADTSVVGRPTEPVVGALIAALPEGDQMALIGYDQSATLLEDFTADKDALQRAYDTARFGNNPRGVDALFAALDEGFENAGGRRIALVVTAGAEGNSRTGLGEVYELARRRGVEIHAVYMENIDGPVFKRLAQRSAGSYYDVKKLKLSHSELARLVFSNLRGRYELTLGGVYRLGSRVQVEISGASKSKGKLVATVLPLD